MKALEAAIKPSRWLRSDCTPQFTSGPLVLFWARWRQQSPPVNSSPSSTDHPTCAGQERPCTAWGYSPKGSSIAEWLFSAEYFLLYCSPSKLLRLRFRVFKDAKQRAVRRIKSLENVAYEWMMETPEFTHGTMRVRETWDCFLCWWGRN